MNKRSWAVLLAATGASSLAARGAMAQVPDAPADAGPPLAPSSTSSPPPPPPPPAPALTQTEPAFRDHYASGRTRLATGDFAGAAAEFAEAERFAVTACDRALAEEQRVLAAEWATRGLAFVQRKDLGESVASDRAVDRRTSDEIVSLYINAVVYGLGTGAWVDALTVGSGTSTTAVVLPPLLFAAGAPGLVAVLDTGRGLRYGVAQSIVSGMYIGLEEGIALTGWQGTQPYGWSGQTVASAVWGMTTLGAVTGGIVGSTAGTTPGRASFVGSAALWSGVVLGLATGAFSGDPNGAAAPLAVSAAAIPIGAIAGMLTAGKVSPSIAHVRFLDLGGIAGFLVGGGLYLAIANNNVDGHVAAGITGLGTLGGLITAWVATSGMPKDEGTTPAKSTGLVLTPSFVPARGGGMLGLSGLL